MSQIASKPFTGRHMALILVGFFGVVIVVNMLLATLASTSFTGVVVENSYVASQHFNRWLDEARAEDRLGWKAAVRRADDGHLTIELAGVSGAAQVSGDAWHPLGRAPDRVLRFAPDGEGGYRSLEAVPAGRWRIRIEVRAEGRRWRTEETVG